MLVDRYQKEDIFVRVPQMAARIDPVLKELDRLLDDDELYQGVRANFGQRYRRTLVFGRPSTPVEVLLRLLLLKHLFGWSYQETENRVDESLVLGWFCRLYWEATPDDTTLIRWAKTLQPETLHSLNDRVVALARQAKVTRGRKLRLDASLQCRLRFTIRPIAACLSIACVCSPGWSREQKASSLITSSRSSRYVGPVCVRPDKRPKSGIDNCGVRGRTKKPSRNSSMRN